MEEIIKIKSDWDVQSSTYITKELYKYVAKGQIKVDLTAKKGSVILDISIGVISSVGGNILYDLIKLIYKKLKKEKEMGREVKPVKVISSHEEFIITGDEESKLPQKMKDWHSKELKKQILKNLK